MVIGALAAAMVFESDRRRDIESSDLWLWLNHQLRVGDGSSQGIRIAARSEAATKPKDPQSEGDGEIYSESWERVWAVIWELINGKREMWLQRNNEKQESQRLGESKRKHNKKSPRKEMDVLRCALPLVRDAEFAFFGFIEAGSGPAQPDTYGFWVLTYCVKLNFTGMAFALNPGDTRGSILMVQSFYKLDPNLFWILPELTFTDVWGTIFFAFD